MANKQLSETKINNLINRIWEFRQKEAELLEELKNQIWWSHDKLISEDNLKDLIQDGTKLKDILEDTR